MTRPTIVLGSTYGPAPVAPLVAALDRNATRSTRGRVVLALLEDPRALRDLADRRRTREQHRRAVVDDLGRRALEPGALWCWDPSTRPQRRVVPAGAALVCSCSPAMERLGACHRQAVADALEARGWHVEHAVRPVHP